MSIISIIVAMNANRIIGNKGDLPWSLPSDLQRFKSLTIGKPVIMGRKTFESILARNGKPLPGRKNVVVTRHAVEWNNRLIADPKMFRDCLFVSSLHAAITFTEDAPEVYIIGGAEIYEQALPLADRMYFTQVGGNFEGDVKFPRFNMNDWKTVHDELVATDNHPYAFSILHRRPLAETKWYSVTGNDLVNPTFARSGGYDVTIADILKTGKCPFCPDMFLWHPWPILHRHGDWFITRNGWLYENAEHHFMIIGNRHIISTLQMTPSDHDDVDGLTRWAIHRFKLTGYGICSRSGDTNYTGATVQHLHFHLIKPKLDQNGKALPVLFPIG